MYNFKAKYLKNTGNVLYYFYFFDENLNYLYSRRLIEYKDKYYRTTGMNVNEKKEFFLMLLPTSENNVKTAWCYKDPGYLKLFKYYKTKNKEYLEEYFPYNYFPALIDHIHLMNQFYSKNQLEEILMKTRQIYNCYSLINTL